LIIAWFANLPVKTPDEHCFTPTVSMPCTTANERPKTATSADKCCARHVFELTLGYHKYQPAQPPQNNPVHSP